MKKIFYLFICFATQVVTAKTNGVDSVLNAIAKEPINMQIDILLLKSRNSLHNSNKQGYLFASKALELAISKKDENAIVRALYFKGEHMLLLGEIDSVIILLRNGIVQYHTDSLKYKIPILNILGKAYYRSGKIDSAIIFHKQVIELCGYVKEFRELKMASLNTMGVMYYQQANYRRAVSQFIELYNICNSDSTIPKRTEAIYAGNIAGIFYSLKDHKLSLEYYKKAIKIFTELGDENSVALTNENIGMIQLEIGNVDTTILYISRAIKVHKKNGAKYNVANSGINLSKAYLISNDTDNALKHINEALRIIQTNSYTNLYTEAYLMKAKIFYEKKIFNDAELYFKRARKNVDPKNQFELLMEIEKLGAVLYKQKKDYYNSLLYLEFYNKLRDSVQNENVKKDIANLESKYEGELKEKHIQKLSAEKAQQELQLKNEIKNKQLISITALFLILFSVGGFIVYRLRQKQKQTQLAQTKAEIENRLLRVQMNPHFMFNSLNSVQSYIASNQNELAEDFLARFAQLTRDILNNSRQDFISLDQELSTLKTYMEIEQQRYNKAFSFIIDVDDNIDEQAIEVPPMLIQPFVENAIIHGVAPLKQGGKITLKLIASTQNSLLCIIQDNGIGRKASATVNKGSKHKSMGMQVTTERFELIKQQTGVTTKVSVIDLTNDTGTAVGTRVEVKIPFKYC